jgi:endonuclease YncB( thermonuclease family)
MIQKRNNLIIAIVCFIISAFLAYLLCGCGSGDEEESAEYTYLRTIDGDTIVVYTDDGNQSVRLAGIDAPEKTQDYGGNSTRALMAMIISRVRLDIIDTDRYGRWVAIVTPAGKQKSCNLRLVEMGLAWVYKDYCDFDACAVWQSAENIARAENQGLWADPSPVPPWEFRKLRAGYVNRILPSSGWQGHFENRVLKRPHKKSWKIKDD